MRDGRKPHLHDIATILLKAVQLQLEAVELLRELVRSSDAPPDGVDADGDEVYLTPREK